MTKYLSLLPVALLVLGAFFLQGCSRTTGCSIEGHTTFGEYRDAILVDLSRRTIDSIRISGDGRFAFTLREVPDEPYALLVRLANPQLAEDVLEMPVFIERGKIRMEIGEYIQTGGTPLNAGLQEFFNSLQAFKDGLGSHKKITPDEVFRSMSDFYKQQIIANKGNALGSYILAEYGIHLLPSDRELVEEQLGNP